MDGRVNDHDLIRGPGLGSLLFKGTGRLCIDRLYAHEHGGFATAAADDRSV